MNNQINNAPLSFGNMPMDYNESPLVSPGIFDNKGGTHISDILGKKINVNSNNINNDTINKKISSRPSPFSHS